MSQNYFELLNKLYKVRVPIICTYTQNELENCGLPIDMDIVTGKIVNSKSYNNMTTCMLSLNKLIDIYNLGYPIHILDESKIPEIYEILENYLKSIINQGHMLNIQKVEEDRLPGIEKFAEEMFGINKMAILQTLVKPAETFGNISSGMITLQEANKLLGETKIKMDNIRPTSHMAYPMEPPKEIKRPSMDGVDKAYMHQNIPNIDFSNINRKSTFRKTFK